MEKTKTNQLRERLLFLERELNELNRRRKAVYRESLDAAIDENAVPDQISNAMLDGPLADRNFIQWPQSLTGIAWSEANVPVLQLAPAYGWIVVTVDGMEHLGVKVGSIASGISARIGAGAILHLEHDNHVPVVYVPYLGQMMSGVCCQWRGISGLPDLERFDPGEGGEPSAWYELAHIHVSSFAAGGSLQLVPDPEDR